MRGKSKKTVEVRKFILEHVTDLPTGIGTCAAREFGISRQAVSRHIQELVDEGLLEARGQTRNRTFRLRDHTHESLRFDVAEDMEEHVIWSDSVRPWLADLEENVLEICEYGITEMVNNVISHSGSDVLDVLIERNAATTRLGVRDRGVGIFRKIQQDFDLHDARHALLELCKGKLTSDPDAHSGEGIFFTSKMFDEFRILSGNLHYLTRFQDEESGWLTETHDEEGFTEGTCIWMIVSANCKRRINAVFDEFASEDADWGFTKTRIVLQLLHHEGGKLLSRSQAKRLLARADQFKEVVLDFKGITYIGQAFADEVFRVFQLQHPEVIIHRTGTTDDIEKMISRVVARS